MREESLLAEIGRRLAAARREANLGLEETARRAAVSSRYLRMAEAGDANLSILKLASLARTLRLPLAQLCDLDLGGVPDQRLALLGLRGAGKTTIGRKLAQRLEVPFEELDRRVETLAGVGLAQVFAIHGEAYYQQLQSEALEQWLARSGTGVLATGGSIVTAPNTFDRLRRTCRTVWLSATSDEHWRRVEEQGDLRPMATGTRAREQLHTLLAERSPRYALADLTVDTTERDPEDIVAQIAEWVAE